MVVKAASFCDPDPNVMGLQVQAPAGARGL